MILCCSEKLRYVFMGAYGTKSERWLNQKKKTPSWS